MAWAIFSRRFDWHRPGSKFSFTAVRSPGPQQWPHDFIEAAINAGAATQIDSPGKQPAAPKAGKKGE